MACVWKHKGWGGFTLNTEMVIISLCQILCTRWQQYISCLDRDFLDLIGGGSSQHRPLFIIIYLGDSPVPFPQGLLRTNMSLVLESGAIDVYVKKEERMDKNLGC